MLTRLQAKNFKSLRDVDVRFGRLSVIVGPNGCGKSSVLQAIGVLQALSLDPQIDGLATFSPGYLSRSAEGVLSSGVNLRLESNHRVMFTRLIFDERTNFLHEEDLGMGSNPVFDLDFIELYRLDRHVMDRPSYSEELAPKLGPDGSNLASVLDALHGEHPDRFEQLEAILREMIPGFRRLRHPRAKLEHTQKVLVGDEYRSVKESKIGHRVVLDFDYAKDVAAEHASEGTLLLVGLLTILSIHDGPLTLMLDDLDRALHPKAQARLVAHLRHLLAAREDLQILATSHSPYLVEHLDYEEVLAMTQSPEDGRSYIAPLLAHPEAARWREEMSAGEFWSSMGEDWVRESKTG